MLQRENREYEFCERILALSTVGRILARHLNLVDRYNLAESLNDFTEFNARCRRICATEYAKPKKTLDSAIPLLRRIDFVVTGIFVLRPYIQRIRVDVYLPSKTTAHLFGLDESSFEERVSHRPKICVTFTLVPPEFEPSRRRAYMDYYHALDEFAVFFPNCKIWTGEDSKYVISNAMRRNNSLPSSARDYIAFARPSETIFSKTYGREFDGSYARTSETTKWNVVVTSYISKLDEDACYAQVAKGISDDPTRVRYTSKYLSGAVPFVPDGKTVLLDARLLLEEATTAFIHLDRKFALEFDREFVPKRFQRSLTDYLAKRAALDATKKFWSTLFNRPVLLYEHRWVGYTPRTNKFLHFRLTPKGSISVSDDVRVIVRKAACKHTIRTMTGEKVACEERNVQRILDSVRLAVEETGDEETIDWKVKLPSHVYRSMLHIFSHSPLLNPFSSRQKRNDDDDKDDNGARSRKRKNTSVIDGGKSSRVKQLRSDETGTSETASGNGTINVRM